MENICIYIYLLVYSGYYLYFQYILLSKNLSLINNTVAIIFSRLLIPINIEI